MLSLKVRQQQRRSARIQAANATGSTSSVPAKAQQSVGPQRKRQRCRRQRRQQPVQSAERCRHAGAAAAVEDLSLGLQRRTGYQVRITCIGSSNRARCTNVLVIVIEQHGGRESSNHYPNYMARNQIGAPLHSPCALPPPLRPCRQAPAWQRHWRQPAWRPPAWLRRRQSRPGAGDTSRHGPQLGCTWRPPVTHNRPVCSDCHGHRQNGVRWQPSCPSALNSLKVIEAPPPGVAPNVAPAQGQSLQELAGSVKSIATGAPAAPFGSQRGCRAGHAA